MGLLKGSQVYSILRFLLHQETCLSVDCFKDTNTNVLFLALEPSQVCMIACKSRRRHGVALTIIV